MPGTFGLTISAFFFIVIPGVVGLKLFLRSYVRLDSLTRIDKLVLSAIGGGAALLLLLSMAVDLCVVGNALISQDWISFTQVTCQTLYDQPLHTLSDIPAVLLLGVCAGETIITGASGHILGDYLNKIEKGATREAKYIEQPWEFASKKILRERTKATVITTDGDRIRGTVHRLGAPSENSNLLLKDPVRTIYNEDREKVRAEEGNFSYSYHHHLDISQVYFDSLEESPDIDEFDNEDEIPPESVDDAPDNNTAETATDKREVKTDSNAIYLSSDEGSEISFRMFYSDVEQTTLHDFEEENSED